MERDSIPKLESVEHPAESGVESSGDHRRASLSGASRKEASHGRKGGRPHKRWKIRLVRISSGKYPQFAADPDHPFASMSPEDRIAEIDSFFALLRARTKSVKPSGGCSAAA